MSEKRIKSFLSGMFRNHKGKKITACVCAAALVASVFPVITMSASAQTTIEARTTDYLNLRSGAGINYSVVKILDKNAKVTITDRSDVNWIKIRTEDGKTGFCSANFLDVINNGKTTTYVNFRKSAGTTAQIIKTLAPQTKLDIITFAGSSWAKASLTDGTVGYICTDYVSYDTVQTAASSGTTTKSVSKPSQETASKTAEKTAEPIKLSTTSRSLAVGNRFVLSASNCQGTAQWSTSDGSIATVNSRGVVTGTGSGTVYIYVKDSKTGSTASCKVKVAATDYSSITLEETRKTVNEGESFTMKATTNPAGGKVYFRSDDTSIAKVTSKGVVTAVGEGRVWITAHDSTGIITASCLLTVKPLGSISITASSLSVNAGSSVKLYATANPTYMHLNWTSSNTNVAGVNDGRISGISPGTATITVSDDSGKIRQSCNVTVYGVSSGNVSLSRYYATTTAGKTIYIKGYNGYRWESSDKELATVWDGFIETKKAGTVAISCTDSYGNKAICNVRITDSAPIRFAYSSPNSATIGKRVELYAITDKTRTDVYFEVYVNKAIYKIKADKSYPDGNTLLWRGFYYTTCAGDFVVKAYAFKNGRWETCSDGKTDVFVTDKTHSSETGLTKLRASDEVVKYIGLKEGFVSSITYDTLANNIPTLGHGYVVWEGQCFYDHLTKNEAYALLVKAVNEEVYSKRINEFLIGNNCRFNQQQFDALVSFSYNLGTGWTYSSDLRNILLNSYGPINTPGVTLKGTVTATAGLNLREEPTTNSKSLAVLAYNETVTITDTQKYNNVWYKVKTSSGKTGYCSSSYLNVTSSSSTTGRDLNYVNRNALIRELLAYHHAGNVCYYGLLYRRADELEMFLYNDYVADGRDNNHNFPNPYCISFP